MEQSSQQSHATPEPVTAATPEAVGAAAPEAVGAAAPEVVGVAAPEAAGGEDALREELAKWRERVPKLAAALRQRAEETEALKHEVDRLRRTGNSGSDASAGIRARDELIVELEAKLKDLAERHKVAEGQLHAHRLQVDELKAEVGGWKDKWHSVTRSLDEQAVAAGQRDQHDRELEAQSERLAHDLAKQTTAVDELRRTLDEAVEERDSLRRRNEQLFETTELANRQIGSLTDSLAELRANLKQHREREIVLTRERHSEREELEALRAEHAELEAAMTRQVDELQSARAAAESGESRTRELEDRLQRAVAAGQRAEQSAGELAAELHLVSTAAASALQTSAEADQRVAQAQCDASEAKQRLAEAEQAQSSLQAALEEQRDEVARLTGVVDTAQRTTVERENERRELSERLQAQEARSAHLEQQLAERSALVVNLEQDQSQTKERWAALEQERDELREALMRAERHVKENAEHVQALDDKLERQKELMESLEAELAEAQQTQTRTSKAPPADGADNAADVGRLQEQVRKLEGLVRERTEALNRLEWRRQMEQAPSPQSESVGDAPRSDADEKLLLVLNQQLSDARARNQELLERLRQLEAARTNDGTRQRGDDLTRIHGVGQKLAEQLNELGIYRYQQIAELDRTELADESHVLYGHRGRIVRDGWIDQAVKLISH